MTAELELHDSMQQMSRVVEGRLSGKSRYAISKDLGIPVSVVDKELAKWREIAQDIPGLKARAKEALDGADRHYDMLIAEFWKVVADADDANMMNGTDAKFLGQKNTALKAIADLEAKRVILLKEAGMLDDSELANQILEQEQKHMTLMSILREVTANCEHCRVEVAERLREYTDRPEPVRVL